MAVTDSNAATAPPLQWNTFLRRARQRVETALQEALPPEQTVPSTLHAGMRHAVFAGGKRLRPLLVLAAGHACGGAQEQLLPAACAVEMIHTYSLVHDDLPAFDDEELRRGKPTCHVLWGEAEAILVGDALQALAFEHMAAAASTSAQPQRWLRAVQILAAGAGSQGMCGGQMLDIQAVGQQLDLDALRALHAAKTGALLTGSVLIGATLAGATDAVLQRLRRYGDAVGLAFQIVDDLLDVEGDVAALGKRPGGDADRQQPTFPALIGLAAAHAEAERLRDQALAALRQFDDEAEPLRHLARIIVERSA